MREYLELVRTVLEKGVRKPSRTGVDTIAYFGAFYKVDLAAGFPLLTTKRVNYAACLHELLWYLSGEDHIRNLRKVTKIWNSTVATRRMMPNSDPRCMAISLVPEAVPGKGKAPKG